MAGALILYGAINAALALAWAITGREAPAAASSYGPTSAPEVRYVDVWRMKQTTLLMELPGVTPRHVGLMMGTMFSFCYVVSAFAPTLVGFLRDRTGSFVPGFVALTVFSWSSSSRASCSRRRGSGLASPPDGEPPCASPTGSPAVNP